MTGQGSVSDEAARIREHLARLAAERARLESRLAELGPNVPVAPDRVSHKGPVNDRSPAGEKIALFRTLFQGHVYPRRRENIRIGKPGYAPACSNEWKPRLRGKPRIKCGAFPNQAFLAVTDEAIDAHLRGRQTLGLYPMLPDGTCRFLAADFDKET